MGLVAASWPIRKRKRPGAGLKHTVSANERSDERSYPHVGVEFQATTIGL